MLDGGGQRHADAVRQRVSQAPVIGIARLYEGGMTIFPPQID
ncbi:MAG: hypothetical protein ACXW4C_05615 [Nitrospira sp.]